MAESNKSNGNDVFYLVVVSFRRTAKLKTVAVTVDGMTHHRNMGTVEVRHTSIEKVPMTVCKALRSQFQKETPRDWLRAQRTVESTFGENVSSTEYYAQEFWHTDSSERGGTPCIARANTAELSMFLIQRPGRNWICLTKNWKHSTNKSAFFLAVSLEAVSIASCGKFCLA